MKATDLMIGDWVKISYNGEVGQVYRIDMANGKGNEYAAVNGGDRSCEDLVPIPLTLEILEKNGWEVSGCRDAKFYWHDDVPFQLPIYGFNHSNGHNVSSTKLFADDFFDSVYIRLSFVHELQHALKLCGIEKEIVL